jgi:N-acetylmuramoyl-L-alanine amidase
MSACGWCAYTFRGHKLRMDYSDGDPDFEQPFYILKHTLCPAVLTENLLMDNQ